MTMKLTIQLSSPQRRLSSEDKWRKKWRSSRRLRISRMSKTIKRTSSIRITLILTPRWRNLDLRSKKTHHKVRSFLLKKCWLIGECWTITYTSWTSGKMWLIKWKITFGLWFSFMMVLSTTSTNIMAKILKAS